MEKLMRLSIICTKALMFLGKSSYQCWFKRGSVIIDDMKVYLKNLGESAEKLFQLIRGLSNTKST